jgi:arabinose-5-phosphate isomerase
MSSVAMTQALEVAKEVLKIESAAIQSLAQRIDVSFENAICAILKSHGRLVVSGVGKSGHIARKIASTFASTGTPAFFVHAGEAGHGDLGMITSDDVLIAISNSGESEEVVNLVSFAKRFGATVIAMTGSAESSTSKEANIHLDCSVEREACPLGLAPTASTSVQLSLGDALAMAVLSARGFSKEDFGRTHPNGSLGRRVYLRVTDVMKPLSQVPHMSQETNLLEAISEMAATRIGAIVAVDNGKLSGIFTDSDLRRLLAKNANNLSALAIMSLAEVISKNPMSISANALASEAVHLFESKHVSRIVCMENNLPVGLLSLFDLLDHKVT